MINKSGNKGEWSEFWVFCNCAANPKISMCDSDLEPLENQQLVVQKIFREGLVFFVSDEHKIIIKNKNSQTSLEKNKVRELLIEFCSDLLKEQERASFFLKSGQLLLDDFQQANITSSSNKKDDISLQIIDPKTQNSSKAGFSIKSQLGAPATLLNASKENTNFVFEIINFKGSVEEVNAISTQSKIRDRINFILNAGGSFNFKRCNGPVFSRNLTKIDSQMPFLLANATLANFMIKMKNKTLEDVLNSTYFEFQMSNLSVPLDRKAIEYKFKGLLRDIALGMVPNSEWDGIQRADGGYIIVKKDLSISCLHVFNWGHFANYLFKRVKFDTPSTERHNFGKAYKEKNKTYFNVNSQLRFTA